MPSPSKTHGLCLVSMEKGIVVTEEAFEDWYDNEHGPTHTTLPGVLAVSRYKGIDNQKPTWLTLYDLASRELGLSLDYRAITVNGSDRDKNVVSQLESVQSSLWSHLFSSVTSEDAITHPAPFLFVVSFEMAPEDIEELFKWYNEEHYPMLMKVPGWIRSRKYKLEDFYKLGEADDPRGLISIHEIETLDALETPEFLELNRTPWTLKMEGKAMKTIARTYSHWKTFDKP